MKRRIGTYTFDASAKTVTFSDLSDLEGILLINNVTDGITIFNPFDPTKLGIVAGNTITLAYDTTLMDDTDKLLIMYDDAVDSQEITASTLPLPTGAATEATVAALFAALKAEDSPAVDGDLGIPMLAMRYATDSVTTGSDGDYTIPKTDEEGRMKVATKPASFDPVSGNATAVGNAIVCDVRRASNVTFHVKNTGSVTLAAGTFVFEASIDSTNGTDGTWFAVMAGRSNANTAELSIALSGMAAGTGYGNAWECSVNAYTWFRVRCTVNVTASAIATWTIQRGSYATEPIPTVQVTGTQPVSGTVTSTVAAATLAPPTTVADVASAAITTTTTTAAITPSAGVAYSVNIAVTATSGTNQTMDVVIEESDDSGTNWIPVYAFPRITGIGFYRSPKLMLMGNRVRYVQTIAGTTPSFTRSINRLQSQEFVDPIRQLFDRQRITTQTLNDTTASLAVHQCRNVMLEISAAAIATTAPAFQLEGSDDNGVSWYAIGSPLTAVQNSTVRTSVSDTNSALLRARVTTAGASATLNYVLLRGY